MNNNKKIKEFKTGTVIFWFFVFFPIGIFLLYKKQTSDKSNLVKNSKIKKIYGWIFIVWGFIYLIQITDSDIMSTMITAWLVCTIPGAYLVYRASKLDKLNKARVEYSRIIGTNHETSLDYIASITNSSYEKVLNNMKILLDLQVFNIGFIDSNRHMYIIPEQKIHTNNIKFVHNVMVQENISQPISKAINCKNCGANNNVMTGSVSECEFCGSPISV